MLFIGLEDPVFLLYLLIGFLVGFTIHESSHALMAYALGDPTAKDRGRLSLNPLNHLHPLGTLSILLLGLGWGQPVPVDATRLRPGPKVGMALVGLAGPLANLVTAALLAIPLRLHLVPFMPQKVGGFIISWGVMLSLVVWLNIGMALFNLIPLAPLDGSRLLSVFLPSRLFNILARYEVYGLVLIVILLVLERFTQSGIVTGLLYGPINAVWEMMAKLTSPFRLA
jgi:Zn-dependent protease